MLRNLKVGTKLLAILAAPALVIVVLVTLGVRDRLDVARSADRVVEVAELAAADADLFQALQVESIWSVTSVATEGAVGGDDLSAARSATDEALGRYEEVADRVDPAQEGTAVAEAVRLADNRVASLQTIRTSVDIGQVQPFAVGQAYAETINALVGVNASLVQSANDPELLRGLATVSSLERISEAQGIYATQIVAATRLGAFTNLAGDVCLTFGAECEAYTAAVQASQDLEQANRAFGAGSATPEERQLEQDARAAGSRFDELAAEVLSEAPDGTTLTVPAGAVTSAALDRLEALAEVDTIVTTGVIDAARQLGDDASQAVTFYLLGGVGALAVALAVAVAVTRSVTRPLDRLTTAAYALSTEQLPALVEQLRDPDDEDAESLAETLRPIPVDSRDEIGQLAEAFNTIQAVTVDVADEQSRLLRKGIGDIFVHLARRNQSLLDRQIEFIDDLERNEEDPDQLENLFRLDHLATRMRRNAESLLVLAGAEPPRRRGRPVPVADVVRVAIGEVEDFARIDLVALDQATIAGNVAVDLAHMLSELMENATHFSPPDTNVRVDGRRDDRNGYVVTVTDAGIGMNAEQRADANAQLARPPLVGLSLTRSLGFIVVGRLAARFGLSVAVSAAPDGGTVATVTLPYSVVEYAEDTKAADEVDETAVGPEMGGAVRAGEPDTATPPRGTTTGPSGPTAPDVAAPAPVSSDPEPEREPAPGPEAEPLAPPDVPVVASPEPAPLPTRQPVRAGVEPGPGGLPVRATTPPAPAAGPARPAPLPVRGAAPSTAPPRSSSPAPAPTDPTPAVDDDELTAAGLVRRSPKRQTSAPVDPLEAAATMPRAATRTSRSPDEVRRMLSRYRSGLDRGRNSTPDDDTPGDADA
ncbi:nitrate- and nitrite sensing domain-containing protein [Rhabdothermincola salaria]|uniref:nitrate- and nitrite sensing domain-containing protein n=1 Tax=Rhabdothermincola salaria TaxID=2903142 RepID=UPI001E4D1741|nr:nitrate- and nitrite sensing domain-containing protein [Rhabdothermincola salaria]MCD9622995.1 nitrate- and nitrite sensing domain-containing protein [Rhabdothermincola salaria]